MGIEDTEGTGDSGLVPLTSGQVSLIWGVSFYSSRAPYRLDSQCFLISGMNLFGLFQGPDLLHLPLLLHTPLLIHPPWDSFLSVLPSIVIID
jgi:hypothetical protein